MKKILGIVVLSLLWCNISFAESVYDFLKKDYEYSKNYNIQNIYAHNSHPTKAILVEKMEVIFSPCGTVDWNNPDRVYAINQKIYPQSDKHITVNARYPSSSKERCVRLWAEFVAKKTTTTKTYNTPKKKKSGAKKLLEKIFGN